MILAGGEGNRLGVLSGVRAKPAVPFGGKYRIIDFTLSNCVNSGIDDVLVLTQYNPRSLNDHIGRGRAWDLDRTIGGVRILQPQVGRGNTASWYSGTADAVLQQFLSKAGFLPCHEDQSVKEVLLIQARQSKRGQHYRGHKVQDG